MYAPFVEELREIVRFQDVVRGEVDKIEILGWVISCQFIWFAADLRRACSQ